MQSRYKIRNPRSRPIWGGYDLLWCSAVLVCTNLGLWILCHRPSSINETTRQEPSVTRQEYLWERKARRLSHHRSFSSGHFLTWDRQDSAVRTSYLPDWEMYSHTLWSKNGSTAVHRSDSVLPSRPWSRPVTTFMMEDQETRAMLSTWDQANERHCGRVGGSFILCGTASDITFLLNAGRI